MNEIRINFSITPKEVDDLMAAIWQANVDCLPGYLYLKYYDEFMETGNYSRKTTLQDGTVVEDAVFETAFCSLILKPWKP